VTYGVVGDRIGYWRFFPASEDGWGVIPVWGTAVVEESASDDLPVGERLYGYLPMASHLTIRPASVKPARLFDGAAHRAELPPVYNGYQRLAAEPGYDKTGDEERMILWPLYATSFCLYDFFLDNDWFGAEQVIVGSASSKTAVGTAYAFRADANAPKLIGLTSPGNVEAVTASGLYDQVVAYNDMEAEIAAAPSAIIDMSGSGAVVGRLHKMLGETMRYTSMVGLTHYSEAGMGPDFIADRSAMFFAPGHIQKRAKDWGPGVFDGKAMAFFAGAAVKSREWLKIRRATGAAETQAAWGEVLAGKTPPAAAWTAAI
ncbi:MAG: DUF2855 family protein, partial [Pseudomonadota bacterium]